MDLIAEIKRRAKLLVEDNITLQAPTEWNYFYTEQAMLIGASIQNEIETLEYIQESYKCSEEEAREIKNKTGGFEH